MKSLYQYIIENQAINFGKANSNYGECIILSGGPGSGKGNIKKRILASYKNVDVDELKFMYAELAKKGKIKGETRTDFNFRDENVTGDVHMKVKGKGWKKKRNAAFWNQRKINSEDSTTNSGNSKLLPNILFDMVGSDVDDFTEILKYAKPLGYRVTVVWVLANIEVAREGNAHRSRRVADAVIVDGHLKSRQVLPKILSGEYADIVKQIDSAWIGLSSGFGRKLGKEYEENPVIKLHKNSQGAFDFDNFVNTVTKFLDEKQPEMSDEERIQDKAKKARQSTFRKSAEEWTNSRKQMEQ